MTRPGSKRDLSKMILIMSLLQQSALPVSPLPENHLRANVTREKCSCCCLLFALSTASRSAVFPFSGPFYRRTLQAYLLCRQHFSSDSIFWATLKTANPCKPTCCVFLGVTPLYLPDVSLPSAVFFHRTGSTRSPGGWERLRRFRMTRRTRSTGCRSTTAERATTSTRSTCRWSRTTTTRCNTHGAMRTVDVDLW